MKPRYSVEDQVVAASRLLRELVADYPATNYAIAHSIGMDAGQFSRTLLHPLSTAQLERMDRIANVLGYSLRVELVKNVTKPRGEA